MTELCRNPAVQYALSAYLMKFKRNEYKDGLAHNYYCAFLLGKGFLMNCKRSVVPLAALLLFLTPILVHADSIDDYVQAEMQKRRLPAVAVVVIRDGKVIKQQAYGLASVELSVAAANETVFQIASITKTFAATAVMTLVEEGKVSLDGKVRTILPSLPIAWRNVTVRHLLTHTSGLPDAAVDDDTGAVIANTRAEALKKLSRLPVTGKPGARWSYNETGYVLLGMIIEKVSGLSFEDFMSQRFFRPLNMTRTRFGDSKQVIAGRASTYTRYERETDRKVSREGLWTYQYLYPSYMYAGAGLNTSIIDLAKWDIALSEGRILRPSTLNEMWQAVRLSNGSVFRFGNTTLGYGSGWMVDDSPGHKAVGHSGGDSAAYIRYLNDKLSVIVLTNCQGADPDSLVGGIAALYIPALAGEGVR